jgi:lysophospholipase L1-like esterase
MSTVPRSAAPGRTRRSPGPSAVRTSPPRRWLAFAAVVVVSLLGVQEAGFRLVFPVPESLTFNRSRYTRAPGKAWAGAETPAATRQIYRVESAPDGFAFDHTLNLYGFRGPDFALEPARGRPRILFVGDSFVEGMGAADGETIPARFAEALGGDRRVEAINLGIIGAGLAEEARLVRDAVGLLRPDAVFLVLSANDLPAPPYPADLDELAPAFPRANPFAPRAASIASRLARGWPVARRWPAGPFPFFRPVPWPFNPLTSEPPPPDADPALVEAMRRGKLNPSLLLWAGVVESCLRHDFATGGGAGRYLGRVARLCEGAGADLVVVYIPASVAVHPALLGAQRRLRPAAFGTMTAPAGPRHRAQQDHLRAATESLGLPFLDLTDAYVRAEATAGGMFWPVDTHATAAGYHLAAEACARSWTALRGR